MFASGRTTGIAVECGAGVTSSVPVFEGLALSHAAVYSDFGGQEITFRQIQPQCKAVNKHKTKLT